MKYVTKLMIDTYNIKKVGCDFLGYRVDRRCLNAASKNPIQFHHLRIAMRDCDNVPEKGYLPWNGALLIRESHEYLHKIEYYNRPLFEEITKYMINMNEQGHLDAVNLMKIRDCLLKFESEYKDVRSRKGGKIIKESYKTLRLTPFDLIENKFLKK